MAERLSAHLTNAKMKAAQHGCNGDKDAPNGMKFQKKANPWCNKRRMKGVAMRAEFAETSIALEGKVKRSEDAYGNDGPGSYGHQRVRKVSFHCFHDEPHHNWRDTERSENRPNGCHNAVLICYASSTEVLCGDDWYFRTTCGVFGNSCSVIRVSPDESPGSPPLPVRSINCA